MLLLAIYRPTARICTEDDLLKLDFGLQMFQKMEVTASNWKYEFQPTLLISAIAVLLIAAVCGDSFKNSKKKKTGQKNGACCCMPRPFIFSLLFLRRVFSPRSAAYDPGFLLRSHGWHCSD
jgi:hypothetical protein